MKQRLFHSYMARVALLYALIFSASTLSLFYFFYLFTASYMTQQVDDTIEAEIQGLAERYAVEGLSGLTLLIADRVNRQQAQASGNSLYLLTTNTFKRLAGNINQWPTHAAVADDWLEFDLIIDQENGAQPHLARAKVFRLPGHYGLLVGRDINQLTVAKRRIVQALTWGLAIMLLLAFIGGVILSRRAARKIERINQTTRNIMSGDLSRRVAVTGDNDDFDQVAQNLNRMLDRIQQLMEDIRRVSDNIAHDLRTPLTRLRQHLEEAQQQKASKSSTSRHLENSIKEADSLLSTFNALLRIARVEAGQIRSGFIEIDFHRLFEDIVEFYEPLVDEKQQRVESKLETDITSWGDRDLMFQAIANIIENSIQYTPPRGHISISLTKSQGEVVISIADNGPGIPNVERKNVFQRFYRLDQSRSSTGNGLGLSMVSAVIAMHNGAIDLRSNHPGLRTIITLPLLKAP